MALPPSSAVVEAAGPQHYVESVEHLIRVVTDLSHARSLEQIMTIVRKAARRLTRADGTTFVLREGELCFYADEEAIAPLWKGKRFPAEVCVSGWAMRHGSVAIEDIFQDERVPVEAYRPTFVKSLAIVPIRQNAPVGAIGAYWAERHRATEEELYLLQALADSTSVAIENVYLVSDLERRVADRTSQLAAANRELEAFAYAASHDLRAPVRHVNTLVKAALEDGGQAIPDASSTYLQQVFTVTARMNDLIDGLLSLSRVTRRDLEREPVDLGSVAESVIGELRTTEPEREVAINISGDLRVHADRHLMQVLLANLLSNAWKFTRETERPSIEFGVERTSVPVFYVRDNGAGFSADNADRLFVPFQRFHSADRFPGSGVGLATVKRIIDKHGGRIWAQAGEGRGATFWFTLEPEPGD